MCALPIYAVQQTFQRRLRGLSPHILATALEKEAVRLRTMAAANPRDPHRTDRLVLAATAWSGNAGHGPPPVDRASAQDAARHRRPALAADRAMRADRGVRPQIGRAHV